MWPFIVGWALSLGYVPEMGNSVLGYGVNSSDFKSPMTVATFHLDVESGPFCLYTELENFQFPKPTGVKSMPITFVPVRVGYSIGARLKVSKYMNFEAYHICEHPVLGSKYYAYGASKTTLSIKIHGRSNIVQD